MRGLRWALPVLAAVTVLLLLVPGSLATRPVSGTVTTCTTSLTCTFTFNTTAGTGWATSTGSLVSFQLPGEAKASYNLTAATYVAKLTGTYTYWYVGNFYGTDVNSGHVVYGVTNVNYTITCVGHSGRGGGCTYIDTTDNGTIVFRFTTAEQTSMSVACSPSSINAGSSTKCTAKVVNLWNASNVPTGKVHFATSAYGTYSGKGTCTLNTAGNCTVTFSAGDNSNGYVPVSVSYFGTSLYYKTAASTTVLVNGGG